MTPTSLWNLIETKKKKPIYYTGSLPARVFIRPKNGNGFLRSSAIQKTIPLFFSGDRRAIGSNNPMAHLLKRSFNCGIPKGGVLLAGYGAAPHIIHDRWRKRRRILSISFPVGGKTPQKIDFAKWSPGMFPKYFPLFCHEAYSRASRFLPRRYRAEKVFLDIAGCCGRRFAQAMISG